MMPDFPIFGGPRKFEGTDDVCALSTHTSIESGERRLSNDVRVGIQEIALDKHTRQKNAFHDSCNFDFLVARETHSIVKKLCTSSY